MTYIGASPRAPPLTCRCPGRGRPARRPSPRSRALPSPRMRRWSPGPRATRPRQRRRHRPNPAAMRCRCPPRARSQPPPASPVACPDHGQLAACSNRPSFALLPLAYILSPAPRELAPKPRTQAPRHRAVAVGPPPCSRTRMLARPRSYRARAVDVLRFLFHSAPGAPGKTNRPAGFGQRRLLASASPFPLARPQVHAAHVPRGTPKGRAGNDSGGHL